MVCAVLVPAVVTLMTVGLVEPVNLYSKVDRSVKYGFLFIGFTFVMGAALILMWLGRIIPYTLAGRFPDELAGMTTLVTQALDLGMVVPLMLATGVLLWRRNAWGYFLAAVSLTFGFIMSITIPAWIVVPLIQDGSVNPVEASPFLVLCLIGLYVAVQFFRSVQEDVAPKQALGQPKMSRAERG